MVNPIVTTNVVVQSAPAPNAPQKKGAFVSQGATTIAAGSTSLLTQLSDLTAILKGALAITSLTWTSNVVTAVTTAPHGYPNAETPELTIAGATPSGYNGTFVCTITGASTFTYPLASNPGMETVPGVWSPEDVAELNAMATTFFGQGNTQAVSVLELGETDVPAGVTALAAYITANGAPFYSYLIPRTWDAAASYLSFLASFESPTSKTYFFTTTTAANYTSYTKAMKCAPWLIEAPGIPAAEFSMAAWFFSELNRTPGPANRVTPSAFTFLFGVTPYPLAGNAALLTAIKAANGSYVGTGSEGQLSNLVLFFGTAPDGNDFSYWYSVDWVQFNLDSQTAAFVMQGSNNKVNPLYYNQPGVNSVQQVALSVMNQGVAAGMVLGQPVATGLTNDVLQQNFDDGDYAGQTVINAIPFLIYITQAPSDFPAGRYAGLTVIYSPNRGFKSIVYEVLVTDFVAGGV